MYPRKYFLVYFKSSGRTNLSIKAFVLLAQEKYLFSPSHVHAAEMEQDHFS